MVSLVEFIASNKVDRVDEGRLFNALAAAWKWLMTDEESISTVKSSDEDNKSAVTKVPEEKGGGYELDTTKMSFINIPEIKALDNLMKSNEVGLSIFREHLKDGNKKKFTYDGREMTVNAYRNIDEAPLFVKYELLTDHANNKFGLMGYNIINPTDKTDFKVLHSFGIQNTDMFNEDLTKMYADRLKQVAKSEGCKRITITKNYVKDNAKFTSNGFKEERGEDAQIYTMDL